MATLSDIIKDPNFVNANAETKKAIFDKYSSTDRNYSSANEETKAAIKKKYGIESEESINWGRLAATTAGGIAGGLVAAPAAGLAAIPTAGLGGLATEAAGVGLGAGIGGQLYDIGERLFAGPKNEVPLKEQSTQAVSDVAENALMVPGARAIGEGVKMAAPYVKPYIRPIIEAIPGTKKRAMRLAEALIQKAKFAGEETSYAAEQQGKSAQEAAVEAQKRADLARAMSEAAEKQKALAAAEAQRRAIPAPPKLEIPPGAPPPQPTRIGQIREIKAEIGKPVQTAASNEGRNIIAQRAKNDEFLRQNRNAIVAENEAKGAKITNMPSYQAIVKRAEPIANWERSGARRPDITVAKTYKDFLKRISPETVELSAKDAAIAAKNGIPVKQVKDKFFRNVEPTFENIDEARRFLGEVFSGKKASEGYSALKETEQKELYRLLKSVEEEYVGRAQPRLQQNWRDATAKLKQFEEGVGPKIIEAEPEKVAEILFKGKGAGSFDEAVAAAGSERIPRKALSDQLATDLADKDYKGALAVYNSKYKQVLQNPKLAAVKQRVEQHLRELNDNEIQGVATKNLVLEENAAAKARYKELNQKETQRVQEAKNRAAQAEKIAQQQGQISRQEAGAAKRSEGEVTRSASKERIHTNKVTEILGVAEKDPAAGADQAIRYLKKLADGGQISPDEYRVALKEYNQIDFKTPAQAREKMKKWLGRIGTVGAAAAGAGGGSYYVLKNIDGNKGYMP